jgi:Selenocysteine lyase
VASQFLDCSPDSIAIVPSASYGISTAARNLPLEKGRSVLVLAEQFPSHYYPWQRLTEENDASLKIVPWPEDHDWTTAVLQALTADVAIAALPNVQWTSGGKLDLVRIGKACREIAAALALDLTQSLGALPFSVRDVQPDFAVAASYKWMLAPYSIGLLYVSEKWQNGRPLEENWIQRDNSRDFRASFYIAIITMRAPAASTWANAPTSHCCQPPFAPCNSCWSGRVEQISETLGARTRQLASAAQEFGFASPPENMRAPHYLCLRKKDLIPQDLAAVLAREKVFVSVRGSSIRVTPHLYNSDADADRLIACLRQMSKSR